MHLALSPGERWIAASRCAERRRAFASEQRLRGGMMQATEDGFPSSFGGELSAVSPLIDGCRLVWSIDMLTMGLPLMS